MEFILIIAFSIFILWLGSKILDKAGLNQIYVFYLLIPVVNIIILWVFAFTNWPNLKPKVKQDL